MQDELRGWIRPASPAQEARGVPAHGQRGGQSLAQVRRVAVRRVRGDDVQPGKWTSFPQSVKLKRAKSVVFSFIVYRSRGQRDRINKKVMKFFMSDPKWKKYMDPKNMPFDGKRMFWAASGDSRVLTCSTC
jgi:uncharacterized protein YbaA (DUF1428 family)